jgi:hypothetical protein
MESMDDERLRKVAFGKEPPTPPSPEGEGDEARLRQNALQPRAAEK